MPTLFAIYNLKKGKTPQEYENFLTKTKIPAMRGESWIIKDFKTWKIDRERFISTIEGMTLNSPAGPLTLRACDHQLEVPMYFGITKKSPKYDFLIAGDIQAIPARVYMPTCAEVMQLRKK